VETASFKYCITTIIYALIGRFSPGSEQLLHNNYNDSYKKETKEQNPI
jgi:hypothetical protein